MPANDIFHGVVKKALVKDDWNITNDPLSIRFSEIDFYIDLGAQKIVGAEKDGKKEERGN